MYRLRVDVAVSHASDRGDQLKSRSRRIGQLERAVEPGPALVDLVESLARDERTQVIQIITRVAGNGEYFTSANIERNGRAGAITKRSLGSELQIDIDAGDQILPFFWGFMVEQRILKTKWVDAPHLPAS